MGHASWVIGRARVAVLLLAVVASACVGETREPVGRAWMDISGSLPSASEVPLGAFGYSNDDIIFIGGGPGRAQDDPFTDDRPGRSGIRMFYLRDEVVGPGTLGSPAITMVLYPHASPRKAVDHWKRFPPEVRDSSERAAKDGDLDGLRFRLPTADPTVAGRGICLNVELRPITPCEAFYGWFQFCDWTLEVIYKPDETLAVTDSHAAQGLADLAAATSSRLDCGVSYGVPGPESS